MTALFAGVMQMMISVEWLCVIFVYLQGRIADYALVSE